MGLFKRLNGTLGGLFFFLYHSFSGVLTHHGLISGLFMMRRKQIATSLLCAAEAAPIALPQFGISSFYRIVVAPTASRALWYVTSSLQSVQLAYASR